MKEWKITVKNETANSLDQTDGKDGEQVNVMFYQTPADAGAGASYSSVWRIIELSFPGTLGPVTVPEEAEFYAIDKPEGIIRESGPYPIHSGQTAEVTQLDKAQTPTVKIVKIADVKSSDKVMASNLSGNVQALEMALFKGGKKVVCWKEVKPGYTVNLSIEPTIYVCEAKNFKEGDDFKASEVDNHNESCAITLRDSTDDIMIQMTKKPSGEVIFTQTFQ